MPKPKLHIEIELNQRLPAATLRALRPALYGMLSGRLPGWNVRLTRLQVGPAGLDEPRVTLRSSHAPLAEYVEASLREEVLSRLSEAMRATSAVPPTARKTPRRSAGTSSTHTPASRRRSSGSSG